MALTFTKYFCNVLIRDAANDLARRRYQLVAADDAAAATNAATLAGHVAALTDGNVVGYSIEKQYDEDGAIVPVAGSQVEMNALLTLGIDGEPRKSGTLEIPAPKPSVFVATTGSNANVVAFSGAVSTFVADFVAGTAIASLSDGEFATSATARWKGKRVHHKSSRG